MKRRGRKDLYRKTRRFKRERERLYSSPFPLFGLSDKPYRLWRGNTTWSGKRLNLEDIQKALDAIGVRIEERRLRRLKDEGMINDDP